MSEARALQLERLCRIGIALSAERNRDKLLERIVIEARELCQADGGTLYLRSESDQLEFAIVHCASLGIDFASLTETSRPIAPIPLRDGNDVANHENIASHCAWTQKAINVEDAYRTDDFDFSGTRRFDREHTYRTQSVLAIPLINQDERVIGVLQLINAKDDQGATTSFSKDMEEIVSALAAQAAVALENQQLLSAQKKLMHSFVEVIAHAIDDKSPYTGGHCRRVPVLVDLLAQAACEQQQGPFATFSLSEENWEAVRIAAWLHDCGKVVTPTHVMDKATKLEVLHDKIDELCTRLEVLKRDAQIRLLRDDNSQAHRERMATIDGYRELILRVNQGTEAMSEQDIEAIGALSQERWRNWNGIEQPLLSPEEVELLTICRGTLSDQERLIINHHVVQTIRMLESLPFPDNLREVPAVAAGHHERIDGCGYPRGTFLGDLTVPARILAIADIFEALTATDRPYKQAKRLSEAMRIMGEMKRCNHIDAELFNLFVESGVYRRYAHDHLPSELIDIVDEQGLIAIEPRPFDKPPQDQRRQRLKQLLPEYQNAPLH